VFKRVRWTAVGYVAGLGTSYAVARKVRREMQKLDPQHVSRQVGDRVRAAVSDGRDEMQRREAELRRGYDPRLLRAVPDDMPGSSRGR
jgi:siroheme synthase (precorrin-2 oxidase/ferrochelatase)